MKKLTNPKRWHGFLCVCFASYALAGCLPEDSDQIPEPLARPVSYVTLKLSNPQLDNLVAGSVESWKKELLGFRVAGRVRYVAEDGVTVEGRVLDEDGEFITHGAVIARLDDERYTTQIREAEARIKSIQGELLAARTEFETSIPNELREVQAEHDRAKREMVRSDKLLQTGSGTQKRADEARAAFGRADALLGQVRSRSTQKQAEIVAIEARIIEAREVLRQAKIDLEDTELFSPYNGQVSKVHVIPGGYVERGQPVVTVQMMDPIKVQVAVSAETDRNVNYNDVIKVYVDGIEEPFIGWVWNKDAVADASTRTFMVTLLLRNRQDEVDLPADLADQGMHRTRNIWNLESEKLDGRPPYFLDDEALQQENGQYFVWKVEGLKIADLDSSFDPVFTVRKVNVRLGARRMGFLDSFRYQEIADLGGLDPEKDLVAGKLPPGVKDGDQVYLSRPRWLLRPGTLVRVDMQSGQTPVGLYVPAQAIVKDGENHYVFAVREQPNGEEQAAKVAVKVGASIGVFQGIEPVNDGDLAEGMKLIVDGAHYLRDGEAVNAFFEDERSL